MNTNVWTTRDGRTIRIVDMGDSHLLNTLRMLERAHLARAFRTDLASSFFQGDMAQFSLECEARRLYESDPSSSFPVYQDLREEADRRKLKTERRRPFHGCA